MEDPNKEESVEMGYVKAESIEESNSFEGERAQDEYPAHFMSGSGNRYCDFKDESKMVVDGIVCSFCKEFVPRADIRRHTENHLKISSYTCETCGKSFPESNKLKLHIRTHTGEKPYQCYKCDKTFATKGSRDGHHRAVHLKENIFQCDQCEYQCTTKRGLLGHKNTMHFSEVFKCDICKSVLVTEEGFRKHVESRKCLENCCEHCGKGFGSKMNLKQHMNTHRSKTEKEYSFNCEKCGKCFTSKQGLTEHDRIHENIKPFPCDICGKFFRKQGGLRAHKITVHADIMQQLEPKLNLKNGVDPTTPPYHHHKLF